MLYQFGYIPKTSEFFDWDSYRIEVVDMDGNRIDRILVTPLAPPEAAHSDPEPAP